MLINVFNYLNKTAPVEFTLGEVNPIIAKFVIAFKNAYDKVHLLTLLIIFVKPDKEVLWTRIWQPIIVKQRLCWATKNFTGGTKRCENVRRRQGLRI